MLPWIRSHKPLGEHTASIQGLCEREARYGHATAKPNDTTLLVSRTFCKQVLKIGSVGHWCWAVLSMSVVAGLGKYTEFVAWSAVVAQNHKLV